MSQSKQRFVPAVCLVVAVLGSTVMFSSSPAPAATRKSIRPSEYVKLLGRGIDVNWANFDQVRKAYTEQDQIDVKAMGFSHVRVRVKADVDEQLLLELDRVVKDSLKTGLIPVIAYQADAFKDDPTEENLQQAVLWWKAVGKRLKATSPLVSFDLIVEVTDALNKNQAQLDRFYEIAVRELRKSNPTRVIFISPRLRSAPEYLKDLKIPSKANGYLAVEWHFYASGPSKTNLVKLWTTGTPAEKQLLLNKFKTATDWSKQTGIPTWVGAWMPGNYLEGNDYSVEEQIVFARFVSCELAKISVPHSVNADVRFYDTATKKWVPELLPVVQEVVKPDCAAST
jgi:hypothetical protein